MKLKTSPFQLYTSSFILLSLLANALPLGNSVVAAELQEIQQRGKLIVAIKDNLRPLGFRDTTGNLQGFEVDVARRLATEILGSPEAVVLQPVTNRDRLPVVLDGKVDLTIARVSATAARYRLVDLSAAYYLDGTALITKDASLRNLRDLAHQKIAVLNGASTISSVRFALPEAQLVGVESYEAARSLLEAKEVAAFAADLSVLTGWVQEYPQYHILDSRLSTEALCVVMPKGLQYEPLRRLINRAIARWKAEGWLQERATYWGLR